MIGQGVSSRSSHSAAAGRTTPSAKPCTQSRMSRWSWLSSREKGVSVIVGGFHVNNGYTFGYTVCGMPPATSTRARAGTRHRRRDAGAVRRARLPGRADGGDRARGRHQQGADLPRLRLQGGAVRPHGHALPRRAARARARAARGRSRTRSTASRASACATPRSWTARCRSCAGPRRSCASASARAPGCGSARRCRRAWPRSRGSSPTRACEDPDFTANRLYTQVLGTMHLARIGLGVNEAAPGVPGAFPLDPETVRRACVADGLALASAATPPSRTPR